MGVFVHVASGVVLHLIPGGDYALGQSEPLDQESAPRRVTLAPFLIGRCPLRVSEWDRLGGGDRPPPDPDVPVAGISWLAAQDRLSRMGLRLPREDEWEAACRGGSSTPWCFGPDFDPAWVWALDNAQRRPQPVEAHRQRANAFGLIDMAGNVSEWCREALDAPMEGSAWNEWDPGRVHRGGSFDYPSRNTRSAFRGGAAPGASYPDLGLRAAADVEV